MHTNHTTNYELSQFTSADKPTFLGDYNGDMLKIDTAIAGVATTASGAVSTANAASATATDAATAAASAASTAATADANASSALATAGNAATAAAAAQSDATAASTAASAADTKATAANTAIGDLTQLTTTDKTDLVSAINEVNAKPSGGGTAASITYDNTTSGLTATDVQSAIDELKALIPTTPAYTTDGLTVPLNNCTINSGGYYVDENNICHVDITITETVDLAYGNSLLVKGFPQSSVAVPATSYTTITSAFNDGQMIQHSANYTCLLTPADLAIGKVIHFIGTYQIATV